MSTFTTIQREYFEKYTGTMTRYYRLSTREMIVAGGAPYKVVAEWGVVGRRHTHRRRVEPFDDGDLATARWMALAESTQRKGYEISADRASYISNGAEISDGVTLGARVTVDCGAYVESGCFLANNTHVGPEVRLPAGSVLLPHAAVTCRDLRGPVYVRKSECLDDTVRVRGVACEHDVGTVPAVTYLRLVVSPSRHDWYMMEQAGEELGYFDDIQERLEAMGRRDPDAVRKLIAGMREILVEDRDRYGGEVLASLIADGDSARWLRARMPGLIGDRTIRVGDLGWKDERLLPCAF